MISFTAGYYGWLGNQMFQYAATKALALHHGTEAAFPQNRPNLYAIFRLRAIPALRYYPPAHTYKEPHFHYDPEFWNQPDWTELNGYFQSEKYFAPYRDEIRREFSFIEQPKALGCKGMVGIHVRRCDYLKLADHHPPCSIDYYNRAMELFPGRPFLVCSDDIDWCRQSFIPLKSRLIVFASGNAVEDFASLLSCDHHIIANSSFSWWAAYLGGCKEQRVIAPNARTRWFGPAKRGWNTADLLPPNWEQI